jgi:nucleoside-diphosphate-sugar epimerase
MSGLSKKILVTGATGFVGCRVLELLSKSDSKLVAFGRTAPANGCDFVKGELTNSANYSDAVRGCNVVIHIAGRAHVMTEDKEQSLGLYREINVFATLALAQKAAAAGVNRFIFISSVKVNGEKTKNGHPFVSDDEPKPEDPYGISKYEAEMGLKKIAAETGMEIVIIRPPLVYGPGVKANFAAMLNLAKKNLPLPLGAIYNKRSMVALDNLVDLIITCIDHPKAANQTFLVSDDCDVSTTELLQLMIRTTGGTPRLIPVPMSWLRVLGKLTGKQAIIDRLCGNLQLDITHTKQTLGWKPPITLREGINRCVK